MTEARSEKIIHLTPLKLLEYHLWASQNEAIFRVYEMLDIFLERNPKLLASEQVTTQATNESSDQDAAVYALAPINMAQRRSIAKWE